MSTNANYYYYAAAAATAIAGILHTVVFKYNRKKSYDRSVLSNRRISTTILDNTHDKEMGKNLVLYRIAGTLVLIIMYFITRVPNPITHRAAPINSGNTDRNSSVYIHRDNRIRSQDKEE